MASPGTGITTTSKPVRAQRDSRKARLKEEWKEDRTRRCTFIAHCVKPSARAHEINGRALVLRDGRIFIQPTTSKPSNDTHNCSGFFCSYPNSDFDGLLTRISPAAPFTHWLFIDGKTHQLQYGSPQYAHSNMTGPFGCTSDRKRVTFQGWEGFCAVEERPSEWAVYFDVHDDALRAKVPAGTRILEIELERREQTPTKEHTAITNGGLSGQGHHTRSVSEGLVKGNVAKALSGSSTTNHLPEQPPVLEAEHEHMKTKPLPTIPKARASHRSVQAQSNSNPDALPNTISRKSSMPPSSSQNVRARPQRSSSESAAKTPAHVFRLIPATPPTRSNTNLHEDTHQRHSPGKERQSPVMERKLSLDSASPRAAPHRPQRTASQPPANAPPKLLRHKDARITRQQTPSAPERHSPSPSAKKLKSRKPSRMLKTRDESSWSEDIFLPLSTSLISLNLSFPERRSSKTSSKGSSARRAIRRMSTVSAGFFKSVGLGKASAARKRAKMGAGQVAKVLVGRRKTM